MLLNVVSHLAQSTARFFYILQLTLCVAVFEIPAADVLIARCKAPIIGKLNLDRLAQITSHIEHSS